MCEHKETYIGKTVGDFLSFESRINQDICECRMEIFSLVNFQYKYVYIIVLWKIHV